MLRALLPTLATLLLYASSAAAECAWVLWGNPTGQAYDRDSTVIPAPVIRLTVRVEPSVLQAYRSYEECQAGLSDGQRRLRAGGKELVKEVTMPTGQRLLAVLEPYCLPDTVDPRGAKGGGR